MPVRIRSAYNPNTIMKVLDNKGNEVQTTSNKRDHEPDRVERQRKHLSKVLHEMKEGYMKDLHPDPEGATVPNEPAIRKYWSDKWRAQAALTQKTTDPLDVDPDALDKWIDEANAADEKRRNYHTPFHLINDLEPYTLRVVGSTKRGMLWLCSHAALLVPKNGEVGVYLLEPHFATGVDAEFLLFHVEEGMIPPLFTRIDFTPQEFFQLLGAVRADKITFPTEDTLNAARAKRPEGQQ